MKTKNKRGVVFFNFGNKCIARLLAALYTLRKVYNGPITLALARNDKSNEELIKDVTGFNVDIMWFDMESKVKRNVKSILKPNLFLNSPYETTLMFDGDLIFMKPFDELWEKIEEHGFLVTHFSNWYSHGRTMSKRIGILKDVFNEKQMKAALDNHPAVNIGVLGYAKGKGDKLLRKWTQITEQVAGKFIADEIAMQGVYFWYDHYIAEGKYNYSCHFGKNFKEAVIIHHHGGKSYSLKRFSSRLWWGFIKEMKDSGINIDKWLKHDSDATEILSKNDNKFLNECLTDLHDLQKNNIEKEQEDESNEDL
jgi:hypothetical protein